MAQAPKIREALFDRLVTLLGDATVGATELYVTVDVSDYETRQELFELIEKIQHVDE